MSIFVSTQARHRGSNGLKSGEVIPIRFYHSVQSGRRYVAVCQIPSFRLDFVRIDRIQSIEPGKVVPEYEQHRRSILERLEHVWGVSDNGCQELTHLEMTIHVSSPDDYTLKRLEAGKRHGVVERIDDCTSRFSIDVWEVHEMIPWVRTFIGSIASLQCSNQGFVEYFKNDLRQSYQLYSEE